MNEGLIPRRYAKALLKVAVERKCDDRMYALMQNLCYAYTGSEELRKIIANPFIDNDDKVSALSASAQALPTDEVFVDFLKLLIQNRRINMAAQISHAYVDLYRTDRNIRRVNVVSAAPLDPKVEQRIRNVIEKHLDGATMEFSTSVDPDLIGGFIVTVDNERLDASLRNQLKEIRLNLLNN